MARRSRGAAAACVTLGDVFTSSSKFLSEPGSERVVALVKEHGGGGGSSVAQAGASVQSLADGLDSARTAASIASDYRATQLPTSSSTACSVWGGRRATQAR